MYVGFIKLVSGSFCVVSDAGGFLEEDVWGLQVLRLIGFRVRGL